MQVTEYIAKKAFGKKITVKDKWGGYTSHDKSAEVIVTFTGEIDPYEANKEVKKILDDLNQEAQGDDPAWISGGENENK